MLNPAQIGMAIAGAKQRFRISPDELRTWQLARLRELVRYACEHSPFYRRHYAAIDLDRFELTDLPPVNKRLVQANFDEVVTDPRLRLEDVKRFCDAPPSGPPWYLDSFAVTLSSGTTGEKGYFVMDAAAVTDAIAMGVRQSTPAGAGDSKNQGADAPRSPSAPEHRFAGVMLLERFDSAGILVRMIPERLGPKHLIDIRQGLPEVVRQLNEFQPTLLASFPYTLRLLAEEAQAGRLHIAPRRVTSSGDVLTASDRAAVEGALGCKIFDYYCCTEATYLAWECEAHQGMHLNADFAIVESVDRNNPSVPPRILGDKILITNLSNRVMPLVRYELSDQVELIPDSEACPCGCTLPRIRTVAGRVEQVITLPGVDGGRVPLIPEQIDQFLGPLPSNYQVIQEAPARLMLNFIVLPGADAEKLPDELRGAVARCFGVFGVATSVDVELRRVEALEPVRPGATKICHYWNRCT